MASSNKERKPGGTPFLLRILLVLAVVGVMATLLPATSGVAQADYTSINIGIDIGGDPGDL